MVAKINTPRRVLASLNYNEQKVKKGVAECLHASGYLRPAASMNLHQKLEGLEQRNSLNQRATTKSIHVSLNFDPSEQFSRSKFLAIAERYMEGIGFRDQPYLVYQHHDAGHPHLHIVASAIREDGSRINLHNIGKEASERTRKEIENEFGLIHATSKKSLAYMPTAIQPGIVSYGSSETRLAIQDVVRFVRASYLYSNLPQFNVCLRKFNVIADAGKEGSRISKKGGLQYRIIDGNGSKLGVPIKASLIAGKPTLKTLENDYKRSDEFKIKCRPHLVEQIQDSLRQNHKDLKTLVSDLETRGIDSVLHSSSEGRMYGIVYIDRASKSVFNGSELGKEFSASGILRQLSLNNSCNMKNSARTELPEISDKKKRHYVVPNENLPMTQSPAKEVAYNLLSPTLSLNQGSAFQKKRRKKKRHPGQKH